MRKYKSEGVELNEAIRQSFKNLPDDSPIKSYLLKLGVEMINECLTAEFAVPIHEQHLREEGRAEGRAEGREDQARFTNDRMRAAGMSVEQRSQMLGLPAEKLALWDNQAT
ncbi:MAG: hypothetical protein IKP61_01415 [Spirochaetales bacterium]|nr:hypothetical protein [Spirochaetales bacterium]